MDILHASLERAIVLMANRIYTAKFHAQDRGDLRQALVLAGQVEERSFSTLMAGYNSCRMQKKHDYRSPEEFGAVWKGKQ